MRLINEHESLLKIFPVSQSKDVNTPYLHLQYLMLSYIGKCRGLPLNREMALCRPGPDARTSGIRGSLSPFTAWLVQSREAYHFGPSLFFWLPSWSLNSWLLLILVVESFEALENVKKSRPLISKYETNKTASPEWWTSSRSACNPVRKSRRVKWSLFTEFILETGSAVLFPRILQRLPQHDSRGLWSLKCLPDYCCWPRGCSCRAKLCHPSPGAEFLRMLSAAYQPLFWGDELLLIVLFKWVKQTKRSCVRLWHWLRCAVVIHCHVSVISS